MFIEKNLAFDQSDIDCHYEMHSKAFDEVIDAAGGMSALASILNVSTETVMRWKSERAVPIFNALEMQYLFNVNYVDLLGHEEGLPLSIVIIRQTYHKLKAALKKSLRDCQAAVDRVLELLEELEELAGPYVEGDSLSESEPSDPIAKLNIAIARGGGILAFSRSLGVSHQVVYQWKKQGYVPTERALTIQYLYGMPYIDFVKPAFAKILTAPSAADLI